MYKKNLLNDIIVPSIKKQVDDAVHSFIWDGKSPRSSSTPKSNVNYNASWQSRSASTPPVSRRYSGTFAIDDIVLASRKDGERVLDELYKVILAYGSVSVADLCELCEYDSNYTDNK